MISYEGIDEATLIHGLYHGTAPVGPGVFRDRTGLTVDDVRRQLREPDGRGYLYIDYFAGRPLKVGLDTKSKQFDPRLYDRDAGSGMAEHIVAKLRKAAT